MEFEVEKEEENKSKKTRAQQPSMIGVPIDALVSDGVLLIPVFRYDTPGSFRKPKSTPASDSNVNFGFGNTASVGV